MGSALRDYPKSFMQLALKRGCLVMIWYKAMLTLETMTIWMLMRKHGYFEGLTLNPKSIKRVADLNRKSPEK